MKLECANYTKSECLGVFFGKIRGKCVKTGREMIHKGMVYVIPGDIALISDRALQDLGTLPKEFSIIGQFGGKINTVSNVVVIEECGTPNCKLENKSRDILEEVSPIAPNSQIEASPVVPVDEPNYAQVNKVVVHQPEGQCDPESELPCSCPRRTFQNPPDELPFPPTESNAAALEEYIRNHYKASQCI